MTQLGAHLITERKVGCDRLTPACENCRRSNRQCQGYDIKLSWPDKYDGRRKQKKYKAVPVGSSADYVIRDGQFPFLNTTFEDLRGRRIKIEDVVAQENAANQLTLAPPIASLTTGGQDDMLLSYCMYALQAYHILGFADTTLDDSIIARMVTTVDDRTNGFRFELMPMALSPSDAASQSLLQATLALSSFHLGRSEDALRYKVKAIKSLSESFAEPTYSRVPQIAACMMLTVYSVSRI